MVHQSTSARLDGVFHALADPTRRALLTRLTEGETTVSRLASPFPMSLTAVSKHLRVLEEAGLVTRTRHGRESVCRLEPGPLAEAWEWIAHYHHFWETRLDWLDRMLSERRNADGR